MDLLRDQESSFGEAERMGPSECEQQLLACTLFLGTAAAGPELAVAGAGKAVEGGAALWGALSSAAGTAANWLTGKGGAVTNAASNAAGAVQTDANGLMTTQAASSTAREAAVGELGSIINAGSKLPSAVAGAVDRASGLVRTATSGGNFGPLHPDLVTRLPALSSTKWAVTNCAEVGACNALLQAGARFEDIVIETINKYGETFAPCANCAQWVP